MSRSPYRRNLISFREYNQTRLDCAAQISPDKAKIAFDVIPYLIHTNHRDLPGYIEGSKAPWGIYLFQPDENVEESLRRYCPGFNFNKAESFRRVDRLMIESLFIMGSIGTVGHTKKSDYDYWVVIDESKVSPEEVRELEAKLAALEKWCLEKKMESHFFISDVGKTKDNEFGVTDKESGGSAQKQILKEEFYRTAILIKGKTLLWWLTPPGISDEEYEEHKNNLLDEGYVDENEVIDLGPISHIPPGELFGALLWQFNKAMESPYKSVIKMGLMESYIMEGENTELLCDKLKRHVQGDPGQERKLDPYLLMLEFIHDYYKKLGQDRAAITTEKCFFLKCFDSPVKKIVHRETGHKERRLSECVIHWRWDDATLTDMNNYQNWDFKKMGGLANSFHDFMIETYKSLTDTISRQENVKSLISENDLTVLGRKLFTLYSRKPAGKIQFLKRVMNEAEKLDSISFAAQFEGRKTPMWVAYRGNITSDIAKGYSVDHLALTKSQDPVTLMIWLTINRIYDKNTFLYFIPNQTPLSLQDVQELMSAIMALFPAMFLRDLKAEDLVSGSYVTRAMVVVNLLSKRWIEEIETLHVLYSNSWGEFFCHPLPARQGLAKLREALGQTIPGFSIKDKTVFNIIAPKGDNKMKLKNKIDAILLKTIGPLKRSSPSNR